MQVNKLKGTELFTAFGELLKKYPPHPNDYPILFQMQRLGLQPSKAWDRSKLSQADLNVIDASAKDGLEDIISGVETFGTRVNGWNMSVENIGTYGTSYRQRGIIACGGLGANLPADAIYPTASRDGDGRSLDGSNKYVVHFDKGKTPPANAFWSITMYDGQGFQVPNPINRFAIGDRDKLHFNDDGSLDIYIQADSPGPGKDSNWLPAPKSGPMGPTLRIYAPRAEALDGRWSPPPVQRVNAA